MNRWLLRAKKQAKKALAPVLYRHRPVGLSAGKLYLYLDALYKTATVNGDVVEVGCNVCGTSALAGQMLQKMGSSRRYVAVDTFGGFVEGQYKTDESLGNVKGKLDAFGANDMDLARRVLELHNATNVELLQGDIVALPPERLPASVSVCLIDVDLFEPVKVALEKVWPKLAPGGVILVDDCHAATIESNWQAGRAYREFCAEKNLPVAEEFGMGRIEKRA